MDLSVRPTLWPDLSRPELSRVTTWVGTSCPVTVGRADAHNGGVYALAGALAALGGLAGAAFHAVNASAGRTVEPSFWLMQVTAAVGYGLLALVLRGQATPALPVTVAAIGLGATTSLLASEWAWADPGATWMVWLGSWSWAPGYIAIIAVLPMLLPDGTLVSPRWRPAAWLGVAAVVASAVTCPTSVATGRLGRNALDRLSGPWQGGRRPTTGRHRRCAAWPRTTATRT